jgi:hypothetical protein
LPVDLEPVDPIRSDERSVAAAAVLDEPGITVRLQDRMVPGHPGVDDDNVCFGVAAHPVRGGPQRAVGPVEGQD